jgi:hypothetical protein
MWIFNALGFRIGELLILAIALSVLHHHFHLGRNNSATFIPRLNPLAKFVIFIIAILSTASWALYTDFISQTIDENGYSSDFIDDLLLKSTDVDLAYEALYLLVALVALKPAAVLLGRDRSLVSLALGMSILRG